MATALRQSFRANLPLAEAVAVAVQALGSVGGENGASRVLVADSLEVAVLDRNRGHRKFRRIIGPALSSLLPASANPAGPPEATGTADAGTADDATSAGAASPDTPPIEPGEAPDNSSPAGTSGQTDGSGQAGTE